MNILTNPTTETIVEVYIVYQVFSAIVQSLPQPAEIGGIWYKSVYNFLSILAADFKSFTKTLPSTSLISTPVTTTTVDKSTLITPISK